MSATPYYSDAHVTLYHGDCLDIVGTLAAESVQLLLTDPPYFRVKAEDWDHQWKSTNLFLEWMGSWMDAVKPKLTSDASVYVFASPELTLSVERLVSERWSVLNVIRWVKQQGWHNRQCTAELRSYLSTWEGIIFAEQLPKSYANVGYEQRKSLLSPIADHLRQCREAAGLTRAQVAAELVVDGVYSSLHIAQARVSTWENGQRMISETAHSVLARLCGEMLRTMDQLKRQRAELDIGLAELTEERRAAVEADRRPFTLTQSHPRSDIWNFSPVAAYPGKHPCEKPTSVLEYMITASSCTGDTVLDLFAGSGSALLAARNANRKAIGVEIDERYCELIASRLAQGAFDFGEPA